MYASWLTGIGRAAAALTSGKDLDEASRFTTDDVGRPSTTAVNLTMMDGTTTVLELKGVECSKAKGQPIFSDVSFTVNEGDVVILQGKSGCG